MEPATVRPTFRVLKELGINPPDAYTSFAEIEHELIMKAQSTPLQVAAGGGERVLAIKDRLWWKVKVQRWRGAVVNPDANNEGTWWLGMAGHREKDANDDFYAEHEAAYKREASSSKWLPEADDLKREAIETYVASWPKKRLSLERALAKSAYQPNGLAVGITHVDGGRVGYLVELHDDLVLVGCVIEYTVDTKIAALACEIVPGASMDDWDAEPTKDGFGVEPQSGQMLYRAFIKNEDLQALLDKHDDVGLS